MKKILFLFMLLVLFSSWVGSSNAQIPECDPLNGLYNLDKCYQLTTGSSTITDARDIYEILRNFGGFLIAAAGVIAGIVIVVAGLMWMAAGGDSGRLASAKGLLRNGIIGALIVFASGVIIATIVFLASNPLGFFS